MGMYDVLSYNPDPLKLQKAWWPHIKFYKEQQEIIHSVWYDAVETYVPAVNS